MGLLLASTLTACDNDPGPTLRPSTLKGHAEVVVLENGGLAPLLLDLNRPLGLCYPQEVSADTSTWQMELLFDGAPAREGSQKASESSEAAQCFKGTPPESLQARVSAGGDSQPRKAVPLEICGRLTDTFTQTVTDAGCLQAFVGPSDTYGSLRQRRRELVRAWWQQPVTTWLPAMDEFIAETEREGFHQMALYLQLTAVHLLARDGSADALRQAKTRLDDAPTWLGRPFSEHTAATFLYQKAMFLRDSGGNPSETWKALESSESLYRRIAVPVLPAAQGMANMIAEAGAVREAQIRLKTALDECATEDGKSRCSKVLEADARGTLARLILLDGSAREHELRAAKAFLRQALEDPAGDPLELANRQLDLATLKLRLGEPPAPALAAAGETLGQFATGAADESGNERSRRLEHWRTLISGLAEIDRDPTAAVEHCRSLCDQDDPLITAWAFSCMARAERQRGRLRPAFTAFDQALSRHELMLDWEMGRRLPLGLDHRADDYARAARTAVELGEPAAAWNLLLRLDQLSTTESDRRRCRQGSLSEEQREQWRRLDQEAGEIYTTLRGFDRPASVEQRRRRDHLARELKGRLRELWRQWPGCEATEPAGDHGLDYRAFALDDEVILLRRSTNGVRLVRRTPFDRTELLSHLDQLSKLAPDSSDENQWSRLAEPLAAALSPEHPLPDTLTYALHGILQAVPLVALPIRSERDRWLGQATGVTLQTAGAVEHGRADTTGPPLFVIDPSGNLSAAGNHASQYRAWFPNAEHLQGAQATLDAVMSRLGEAHWIHFDTHGYFDPALPELSSLQLAESPLHWLQLTGLAPKARFVNLSGCQTGRWPITADSGAYGIAGLFTRLGTPWAVGSRNDLPDSVAAHLNRVFYQAVRDGADPPEAFRRGIREVSQAFPAPQWSGLILLKAADRPVEKKFAKYDPASGQISAPATPPPLRSTPGLPTHSLIGFGTDGYRAAARNQGASHE